MGRVAGHPTTLARSPQLLLPPLLRHILALTSPYNSLGELNQSYIKMFLFEKYEQWLLKVKLINYLLVKCNGKRAFMKCELQSHPY